jgi:arylsulfate sulfotransferase
MIFEVDLFGNVINSWDMPGYAFHHQVLEKPNGNFLVTVNKLDSSTIEDYIIEIDRENGEIINEWDLNQSLQNNRITWTTDTADWVHVNALYYDATDDTIVISGRTQGVVKLTAENEVVWILAPHKGWGLAGDGEDLNQYLLQPLDAEEQPISDLAVLDGDANHPDFEWQWYQHAPSRLDNGDILLFDNGDSRNYGSGALYSRAVRYRIEEAAKTVRQIWEYGKLRGTDTYSRIVSDVDYIESADNVLFSPGAIQNNGASYGKCIEVDYTSREVVFEATLLPPTAFADIITFHRTERLTIYPQ